MKPAQKGTQESSRRAAAGKQARGFTDEERGAMRERLEEVKAESRRGPQAGKAEGESAVLEKIAALQEPDRAMALRLPEPDVARAREIAARKGIGYQTLLKMLVHEGLRREARRA
jgi:predicted DNA binding CopG/RHH family protein